MPLVTGGAVRPLPPLGKRLAVIAERALALPPSPELEAARLRAARQLASIDGLPPLGASEWRLTGALSDLLQAANPRLASSWDPSRPMRLLEMTRSAVAASGPPATLLDALGRFALFARALELGRWDTTLSFWAGRRAFAGREPPARLRAWPELRRVREQRERTSFVHLADGQPWAEAWLDGVADWLRASPLSDLHTADRERPRFAWSAPTLQLAASPAGRTLALRSVLRARSPWAAVAALTRASSDITASPARALAEGFASEARAVLELDRTTVDEGCQGR